MELIFVYNAKSNLSNKAFDFAHKILSPETYSCELCSITHHQLGERQTWKAFREKSDVKMRFLYKNEFEKSFDTSYDYPVILFSQENVLQLLMNKSTIAKYKTAEALSKALTNLIANN